jgi:dTDP-4-amino-4,6-dideoxygalactose transaminase
MSARQFRVWPSLPPDLYLRRRSPYRPFPLDRPECRLYSRARHALWAGCAAIGLRPGDEVLAPAYHHGSEIEVLVRAGLRVRFFDVDDTLEPDPDVLERSLTPAVRALYLIHYLGLPQDAARWRTWCDERGLMLVEDAAQAWLSHRSGNPVGSYGHLAIFCLYKTVGIPDGAASISRTPPDAPRARSKLGFYGVAKRHGAWLCQRGGVATWALDPLSASSKSIGSSAGSVDAEFELGDPRSPPSAASRWLLPRVLDATIADRRRRNYGLLLDSLGDLVPAPFTLLPSGASPFAFPIGTTDAAGLVTRLDERGVKGLLLWRDPHPSLDVDAFPVATRLRASVVALPVHQELTPADARRIAAAVRSVSLP